MSRSKLEQARDRVSEACILLAGGASAEAIAEALLRALDELDALRLTTFPSDRDTGATRE